MGRPTGASYQLSEEAQAELMGKVEVVTGAEKSVDVVVEIFNEANSGGTKLSSAIWGWRRCAPPGPVHAMNEP